MEKSADAFRTISEVSEVLETPAHVLRFWESRFPQIRPVKRAGGRRYYRPADVALLSGIRRLLHEDGMTIRGVQKILREQGVRHVSGLTDDETDLEDAPPAPGAEIIQHDFGFDPTPPRRVTPEPVISAPSHPDAERWPHWGKAHDHGTAIDANATPPEAPGDDGVGRATQDAAQADDTTPTHQGPASGGDADERPACGAEPEATDSGPPPDAAETTWFSPDVAGASAAVLAADGRQPGVAGAGGSEGPVVPDESESAGMEQPDAAVADTGADQQSQDLPQAHLPAAAPPGAAEPDDALWLPALLRALPSAELHDKRATLLPLYTRLAALRDRMADAAKSARK